MSYFSTLGGKEKKQKFFDLSLTNPPSLAYLPTCLLETIPDGPWIASIIAHSIARRTGNVRRMIEANSKLTSYHSLIISPPPHTLSFQSYPTDP